MKKISNKQKIIILIAILAIIVIIGILIGTNAIKVNILTGKFNSANNDSSNGNLLPEYIKAGITLGGVTGTLEDLDTSDATATPEDILWPKTAYVNGVKITGTRDAKYTVIISKEDVESIMETISYIQLDGTNITITGQEQSDGSIIFIAPNGYYLIMSEVYGKIGWIKILNGDITYELVGHTGGSAGDN